MASPGTEDAVNGAVAARGAHRLVLTNCHYLMLDQSPWSEVGGELDECWYQRLADDVRPRRLTDRQEAAHRAEVVDLANADLVRETTTRADLVVELGLDEPPRR